MPLTGLRSVGLCFDVEDVTIFAPVANQAGWIGDEAMSSVRLLLNDQVLADGARGRDGH